ncbi:hypothetical protein ACNF42_04145 [Cuniculiplasma sp. SKW3]|uniref:hypothetical protein n=1 Tax=unclassified Cuniculiplasma TaxID=2619706 RepID=UPI003FD34ECB
MPPGKLTRSQRNFIEKLSQETSEKSEEVQHYLIEKGLGSIDELSVSDASTLIEKLKSMSSPIGARKSSNATKKQIIFIKNLQSSSERLEVTEKFLKEHGKGSLDEISMEEASLLIDLLKNTTGGNRQSDEPKPASPKQLDFIEKLQSTEREKKIVSDYLARLKKGNIDDLSSKEASALIERLKS